jgi:hypothetical protein
VTELVPRLETLPVAQGILWPRLSVAANDFVLYGGTAISLQLGGRVSVDFDFFTANRLNHDELVQKFSFLRGARLQRQGTDTAIFVVAVGNQFVVVSFFGGLEFGRVSEPIRFVDNGLFAAGLLDLAVQKMKVIQQRAETKDYLDIHTLLSAGITLEMALGAAQTLYPEFNPAISLKALSYFADVPRLPADIQAALRTAASLVREISPIAKLSRSLHPTLGATHKRLEIDDRSQEQRPSPGREPELEM